MSGHSKWSTIKHKKGAADAKRGKIFNRLSRELMISARLGGADIASNSRLRIAVSRARAANMPKDTIERAITKGAGGDDGQTLEEVRYEIFAPGGVGVIVEAMTDKKARTTPEIKSIVNKHGCNLAEPGAVSRLFQSRGYILVEKTAIGEEELMDLALEAGAEDMTQEDAYFEILSEPENFSEVAEALSAKSIPTEVSEVRYMPMDGTEVEAESLEKARKFIQLIELFEDHDDVQEVYHNMSISDEIMAELSAS